MTVVDGFKLVLDGDLDGFVRLLHIYHLVLDEKLKQIGTPAVFGSCSGCDRKLSGNIGIMLLPDLDVCLSCLTPAPCLLVSACLPGSNQIRGGQPPERLIGALLSGFL